MELWDAFYADGTPAGRDLVRGEPIPDGLYHIVCEILVKHTDGAYLLMQRDFNKIGYPGMFEASAGGSALKGESPDTAAARELKEETGIDAGELMLISQAKGAHTLYYFYRCITDCDKSSVTLQEGETVAYRWVSPAEFLRFIASDDCIGEQRERLREYIDSLSAEG